MKIYLTEHVSCMLNTALLATRREFSGFGWVKIEGDTFVITDAVILAAGSEAFTEIQSNAVLALLSRPDAHLMKLWFHRHPMGNGIPGPHNWSSVDHNTARETPLGGIPDMVKWSISMVYTLGGWVGRYDTYGQNGKTVHIPVVIPHASIAHHVITLLNEHDKKERERFAEAEEIASKADIEMAKLLKDIRHKSIKRFPKEQRDTLLWYRKNEPEEWRALEQLEAADCIELKDYLELLEDNFIDICGYRDEMLGIGDA